MNKKGVIAIIVIIILVIIGFSAMKGNDSVSNPVTGTGNEENTPDVTKDSFAPVTKDTTDTTLLGRLKSASVSAAETGNRVALSGGMAKFSEGSVKGTITLGDIAIAKTTDGANYVLSSLAVNSGGSGTFHYVVLFEDKNGTLTDKSYALIGDRVRITGIRADEVSGALAVTVSYLGHDQGEPLSSAPSVPKTKILVVENGAFNAAKEINL
jgi:hypothetical protein